MTLTDQEEKDFLNLLKNDFETGLRKSLFNTKCKNFYRNRYGKPLCKTGHNRQYLSKSKTGYYQGFIANCVDCPKNNLLKS